MSDDAAGPRPSGSDDLVIAELMVLREGFETERKRSASTMGRATWAHARDIVDGRLHALGVDISTLGRGRMSTGPATAMERKL